MAKWNKSTWATQLSPLLIGKAVEVYNRLSPEKAMDYERLKVVLLERYDFTERGYREKFREATPEGHESSSQFSIHVKKLLHQVHRIDRNVANLRGRGSFDCTRAVY